ncbi:MAG: Iron-chelate-transporting ATPase [Firmicutes bacterium]|nr:Iron-chelate-transporting ATPase [Bacillota bacterium]
MAILSVNNLTIIINNKRIIDKLSLNVEAGKILSIIGPNGSGKSTLIKALTRSLKPFAGQIELFEQNIRSYSANKLARQIAVLHQKTQAPGDLSVRDLVAYGRFPYQYWWKENHKEDTVIIDWALAETGLSLIADRPVNTLSGGEQQRAWIAMALAQQPRVLFLDEPTTFLDIAHQIEILELITSLNKQEGITVVMVVHDMNHAVRYSDIVAVMQRGKLYSIGQPKDIITPAMLRDVFGVEADILQDKAGQPFCVPTKLSANWIAGREAAM